MAAILLLISNPAFSNPFTYECEIKSEYSLSGDGALIPSKTKIYNGNKFNVVRLSWVVLGGGFGNSTYPTKIVIDPGGMEQSYATGYAGEWKVDEILDRLVIPPFIFIFPLGTGKLNCIQLSDGTAIVDPIPSC